MTCSDVLFFSLSFQKRSCFLLTCVSLISLCLSIPFVFLHLSDGLTVSFSCSPRSCSLFPFFLAAFLCFSCTAPVWVFLCATCFHLDLPSAFSYLCLCCSACFCCCAGLLLGGGSMLLPSNKAGLTVFTLLPVLMS